jgi:hypothetical protein
MNEADQLTIVLRIFSPPVSLLSTGASAARCGIRAFWRPLSIRRGLNRKI